MKLFASAWISASRDVAPCAGAWIETSKHVMSNNIKTCRPLRGGVD